MLTRSSRKRRRVAVGVGCAFALTLSGIVFAHPAASAAAGASGAIAQDDELAIVSDTLVLERFDRVTAQSLLSLDSQHAQISRTA